MTARTGLAALMLVAAAMPALAQDEDVVVPAPCSSAPYEAFDFWLGEWRVSDIAGEFAGTNTITEEEDGCLLVERWSGAGGSSGQSYNYYDPGKGVWRQVWVSSGANIDYEGGLNQRGQMILEGEITYRSGRTYPFRGTWTPNEDGSVKQHFEQFNPETDSWDDWFIGIYRKP